MKREELLKIMDKCCVINLYEDGEAFVSSGDVDEWVECLRAVEKATLERAAKVCEEISEEYARSESRKYPELKTDAETGASDCEHAIRALKDSHE